MTVREEQWWGRWIGLKTNQAHFFYMENDLPRLERVLEELEPAVALHGTHAQRMDLLHVRQQHRYRRERYALSERTEELAREIYALEPDVVGADFILGFCLLWRGKLDEAERCFERGLQIARAEGVAIIETRCLVYSLVARRKAGDVEGARARHAELEALTELHGYFGLLSANAAWLAYRDGASIARPIMVRRRSPPGARKVERVMASSSGRRGFHSSALRSRATMSTLRPRTPTGCSSRPSSRCRTRSLRRFSRP